jgi:hypothetical protein
MEIRKMMTVAAASVAGLLSLGGAAFAQTVVTNGTSGWTVSIGTSESAARSGVFTPANVVPNSTVSSYNWKGPLPGSSWISYYVNGQSGLSVDPNLYDYKVQFNASTPFSLSGTLYADNQPVDILLDGVSLESTLTPAPTNTPGNSPGAYEYYWSTGTGTFGNGGNNNPNPQTLEIIVNNITAFPTGLDLVATASSSQVPEPGTYAAFLIGGLGVLGLMIGARKRSGLAA